MTKRINVMYAGFIVETATTLDLFADAVPPVHGRLLHSIPRLDAVEAEPLIPIEGRPPDMRTRRSAVRSRRAARWRLDTCWTDEPGAAPVDRRARRS